MNYSGFRTKLPHYSDLPKQSRHKTNILFSLLPKSVVVAVRRALFYLLSVEVNILSPVCASPFSGNSSNVFL